MGVVISEFLPIKGFSSQGHTTYLLRAWEVRDLSSKHFLFCTIWDRNQLATNQIDCNGICRRLLYEVEQKNIVGQSGGLREEGTTTTIQVDIFEAA